MAKKESTKSKKNSKTNLKAGILIFLSVIASTFSFYAYQVLFTANFNVDKEAKYLYIPTQANFGQVLDSLDLNKIINEKSSFLFLSKLMNYRERIKPGRYLIEKNMNNLNTIRLLRSGAQTPVRVAIQNIRTKEDLAKKIAEKLEVNENEILKTLSDNDFLSKFDLNENTVISIFIANSYDLYWSVKPESLVKRMLDESNKFWTAERKEKAKNAGLNPVKVIILASIVESETNLNSEKPRVAGVYINRLNANQLLQADPTVKFALKDFAIKRILFGHLTTDSPYNTYKYKGLPPGPICIPSISSVEAVLNFEKHKYYFFCANPDLSGNHDFTETFQEHVNKAQKFRTKMDNLKILK